MNYEAKKQRDEAVAEKEKQLTKLAAIERGVAIEETQRMAKRKCEETLKKLKKCYEDKLKVRKYPKIRNQKQATQYAFASLSILCFFFISAVMRFHSNIYILIYTRF